MNAAKHWDLVSRLIPDADALAFLRLLNEVVNVWDDLVDGDNPEHSSRNVNMAFEAALIHIPRNPFYRKYQHELQPVIEVAIADWHASTVMQASGDAEQVARAHTLRFSGLSVWVLCARIIGGPAAAALTALELRRAIPAETLQDFSQEMAK